MGIKKYQVFISSTYTDLIAERSFILHSILSNGNYLPTGMELFPASGSDQWTHIENVINESDYYIVIVAGRYGSLYDSTISYTQKEFEYAKSINKPVIAFIHSDLKLLPKEKVDDGDKLEKLELFKSLLQKDQLCKPWSNMAELAVSILNSLGNEVQANPGVGWIRGNQIESLPEIVSLKNENISLKKQLEDKNRASDLAKNVVDETLADGEATTQIKVHGVVKLQRDPVISITWNEIIKLICPDLFAAKYDFQVEQIINGGIKRHLDSYSLYVDKKDVNKIKMQLLALGLISETATVRLQDGSYASYWQLTILGKSLVSKLLAEKKV
tara:strand:+ start:1978 stop:2961 length:984 start_codon:yes stop_codon:yes gene_type:complete